MGASPPVAGWEQTPTVPNSYSGFSPIRIKIPPTPHMKTFHHKSIRLPLNRYVGTAWFFVTFCCEHREKIFANPTRAKWFVDNLRSESLTHTVAIHAYCIMPNHVHLLTQSQTPTTNLLQFLKSLKRKTGFAYKQKTAQQLWQKKSYDHALRSTDPTDQVAWYIWLNPVRANLCATANEYPWSGSLTGARPNSTPPTEPWSPPWRSQGVT
ncbi:MAG: transposase [Candidatus Acidoferrum typicum]|nr:transposase [Candidatus Acidoferrum typicum]